ncbi:broad specificity phosphatase PhoE [Paenibacillus sacheonensis]|nr:broad specificity phosphatase PhoE [Paenibacillus sacheonensis]
MTTIIGLIRHGVTDWNQQGKAQGISDIPLNEEGVKQAAALADRLSGEQWDAVYSSTLMRAKQTAERVRHSLGIASIVTDERIREIDCGRIEGTTEAERIARWGANWRELDLGIEDSRAVAGRGLSFLNELLGNTKTKKY